jgi:hypothetical protein
MEFLVFRLYKDVELAAYPHMFAELSQTQILFLHLKWSQVEFQQLLPPPSSYIRKIKEFINRTYDNLDTYNKYILAESDEFGISEGSIFYSQKYLTVPCIINWNCCDRSFVCTNLFCPKMGFQPQALMQEIRNMWCFFSLGTL